MRYRNLLTAFFITALALALSTGMAFAGNTATVDQDGTGNIGEIEQAGSDNTAYIDQTNAVNNRAFIDQSGDDNEATINQTNASGTQQLHYGTIDQIGDGNEAILDQSMWYGNVGHTGSIEQTGYDNFANLQMGGANNDRGTINQTGNDNIADIDQMRGASGTSNPAIVEVNQTGDLNEVYMDQHSSTWTHAYIDQIGDENYVDLRQAQADHADIWQEGDRNEIAGVTNNDGLEFALSERAYMHSSEFHGTQIGNDNTIGLYQRNNNLGTITQTGNDNEALLYQGGTGGHTSTIIQTGDQNTGHVKQTVAGALGNITQTGSMNQAYINQF